MTIAGRGRRLGGRAKQLRRGHGLGPRLITSGRRRKSARRPVDGRDLGLPGQAVAPRHQIAHVRVGAIAGAAFDGDVAAVAELIDVVLDAPLAPRSRTRSGRTSAVMISSGRPPPVASGTPSKPTIIPSPIESKVPSEPHRQTDAVTARLQNALAWLVTRQPCRMGAV